MTPLIPEEYICRDCGYAIDTPNHERGCAPFTGGVIDDLTALVERAEKTSQKNTVGVGYGNTTNTTSSTGSGNTSL